MKKSGISLAYFFSLFLGIFFKMISGFIWFYLLKVLFLFIYFISFADNDEVFDTFFYVNQIYNF